SEVIWNSAARNAANPSPATIRLGWTIDGTKDVTLDPPRAVLASGVEQPLAPGTDASSFRLDQPLMDRLIGRFPHERARIFLRAFFPEALDSLSAYEQTAQDHEQAFADLQRVVDRLTAAKAALTELQAWRGGASTPTQEEFPVLLNKWLEQTVLV